MLVDSRSHELAAAGDLLGQGFAGITGRIEELHRAIADRSFGGTGAASKPAKMIHDGIAGGIYAGLRHGGRLAGKAGGAALAAARPELHGAVTERPAGRFAAGVLNGLMGDRLDAEGNALAARMGIRRGGRAIDAADASALRAAFPDATSRVVVFLHGLCENEGSWGVQPYGARLRVDLGLTPVTLRYNTGRPIADNGADLAALLDDVVVNWPVRVDRLDLVGHSMGGLVIRSAAYRGGHWTQKVRHIVYLSSPHTGAPLERAAERAVKALRRLPEGKPIESILRSRSQGIRDLHGGLDHEPLPHVRHHCVSATLRGGEEGFLAETFGDLLVTPKSALGSFVADDGAYIPGASHFALLNHPGVYERLRGWLGE